jgi:hypothetical protein
MLSRPLYGWERFVEMLGTVGAFVISLLTTWLGAAVGLPPAGHTL